MLRYETPEKVLVFSKIWTINKKVWGIETKEDNQTISFSMYPNPSKDKLVLKSLSDISGNLNIKISGINGELLKDFICNFNSAKEYIVDLKDIYEKVLLVSIINNGEVIYNQIIVKE